MDSIKVAIKVRPLIKREKEDNLSVQWTVQDNSIASLDPELKKRGEPFYFDHIFDSHKSNYDVFNVVAKPIVDAAINGINGTIFAYGQTSSGKTFTMMGEGDNPGVIPLAINYIFDRVTSIYDREFLIRVSYIEIYNEKINDLLDKNGVDLKIKEEKSGQAIVTCKEEVANSSEYVLAIMRKGLKNRRIGETNMNERSSRSHTIFRITIESRESESDGVVQISQLNLVDLAGSERPKQSGATGDRFNEGRHINLSLSALGLVIMQLSETQDNPQRFVNFRDSKLTRILQASLGGNAMTTIICAVTPAALDETQCTLAFASRAKRIKNKPQVNECVSEAALLKRYAKQLAKLKNELEKARGANLVEMESKLMEKESKLMENETKLEEKDRAYQLLEERIELLKTRILSGNNSVEEDNQGRRSKRRRTWGGPGTFQSKLMPLSGGLPTIKELEKTPEKRISKEHKKRRQSIIQSLDIPNQTFQTAFTDFELELIESERSRNRLSDGSLGGDEEFFITTRPRRNVQFMDDVSVFGEGTRSPERTPEKKTSEPTSPETPRQVLRSRINFLIEQYNALTNDHQSLVEFTSLEKQMFVEDAVEAAMVEHNKTVEKLRQEFSNSEKLRQEIMEKYAKLQNDSAETDKRLNELQNDLTETTNSLRKLTSEKEILADELETLKTRNPVREEENNVNADKETSSIFANNTYFDDMNISDPQCYSTITNDTENMESSLICETSIAKNTTNCKMVDSKFSKEKNNSTCSEFLRQIDEKSGEEITRFVQDILNAKATLEEENMRLEATLTEKIRESDDVKNDIRELKSGIEKLQETFHHLTTENNDLTSKINDAKEFVTPSEKSLHSTIAELNSSIHNFVQEKIAMERTVREMDEKLKPVSSNDVKITNELEEYKKRIDALTLENEELSTNLMDRIQELDRLRDVDSDHDCAYRKLMLDLSERNKLLETENIELSNNVMERTEEYDRLKEEYESLRCKISSGKETSKLVDISMPNEENLSPISEANKSVKVDDLLRVSLPVSNSSMLEKLDKKSGKTVDDLLRMSIIPGEILDGEEPVNNEKIDGWKLKAEMLREQVENLTLLNKKLTDLDATSCKQCTHLIELKGSRRMLQNEVKTLNRTLEELQIKFDREFADTEILRTKANEDLNLSYCDASFNVSTNFDGSVNVSYIEERVQSLHSEIEALKTKHEKLSNLYKEKCEEIEKLNDNNSRESVSPSNESPRLKRDDPKFEKIATEMDKIQNDLRGFKKCLASVRSALQKFVNEKNAMQSELEALRNEKRDLEEKLKNKETCTSEKENYQFLETSYKAEKEQWENEKQNLEERMTREMERSSMADKKIESLETEVTRLSSEIENYEKFTEALKSSKLSLDSEVERLRLEKQALEEKITRVESAMEKEISRLNLQLEDHRRTTEELENSKILLETKIQSLELEKEENNLRNDDLLRETNETIESLNQQVVLLKSEIENSHVVIKQLEDAKSRLENEIQSRKVEENNPEEIRMENEISSLEGKVSRLVAEMENCNAKKQELEEAKAWLETKVESLKAENEAFEKKLADTEGSQEARKKIELLENEVSRLICEIEKSNSLKTELEDAKNQMDSLKMEQIVRDEIIQELQRSLQKLDENNSILKIELENLNAEKMDLATILDKKNNQLDSLKESLETLELKLKEVSSELEKCLEENVGLISIKCDLEGKIEALTMERVKMESSEDNDLSETLNQLQEEKSTLTTLSENLQLKLEEAMKDLNDCTKERIELTKRLNELEYSSEESAKEKSNLKNDIAILQEEIKNLKNNVNSFTERIEILEGENSSLTLELSKSKSSNDSQLAESSLYKTPKEYERMIEELTEKLEETEEELKSNSKERKELKEELTRLNSAEEDWKDVRLNLENKIEVLKLERNELRENLENLRVSLNKLNEKNESSKEGSTGVNFDCEDYEKNLQELESAKKSIKKEIMSLKPNENNLDLGKKTTSELFSFFVTTIMTKEGEVIKALNDDFEKEKRRLEENKRQSIDAEKRASLWAKELEAEIERTQQDLISQEAKNTELLQKIANLENLLMESNHENEMLNEKMKVLEADFDTLGTDLEKSPENRPNFTLNSSQEKDRSRRESVDSRELELSLKLRKVEKQYKEKLNELTSNLEYQKTRNIDLSNNLEGLEANEKQLKSIVDMRTNELAKCNAAIDRLKKELEATTESYNQSSRDNARNVEKIEEITNLLKKKCDNLSEYKTKLEIIMPEYEKLKEQANERQLKLEKYKSEMENVKAEKEKDISSLKDRLDSEEIKSSGYRKQLAELTNRNATLQMELVELGSRCDELKISNEKMAKSMRNSTSKIRAEEEMEELRDRNRTLERNLDGAGNRINELQDLKTRLMKDLVDLRVQYEAVCTENEEMKSVLSSHRSSLADTIELKQKYEESLQNKNRLEMEMEDKRSRFIQMEKKIEEKERENEELKNKNVELDAEMDDIVLRIHELTKENSELDEKLYNTENTLASREEKIKELTQENCNLETKLRNCIEEIEDLKCRRKKLNDENTGRSKQPEAPTNDNSESRKKLLQLDRGDSMSCNESERSCSPAAESTRIDNRRRSSRNELFNMNRPLEIYETENNDENCRCKALQEHYSKLEKELALKNAKIATLELKIQSEIFPHMRKCKDLEEILASTMKKNKSLKAEIRKIEETRAQEMSSECERCKQWRLNKRDQASQCMPDSTPIYMSGMSSGIIDGHVKVAKLEKDKSMLKTLCRNRQKRIFELEERIKDLENCSSVKTSINDEKSAATDSSVFSTSSKPDSANSSRQAMKENVPVIWDNQRQPQIRRNWFN